MLYKWRRIDADSRRVLWKYYGFFCGLIMCGSCFGAVTWAAWNRVLFYFYVANKQYPGSITRAQQVMLYAFAYPWRAVFVVTYSIEFLCLSIAKLTVLDRMLAFMACQQTGSPFWRKCIAGWKFVTRLVVAGNIVGLLGNIAAASYYDMVAQSFRAASASYTANTTAGDVSGYNSYHALADDQTRFAHSVASIQSICEVTVLLLIVVSFLAAGIACIVRVKSNLAIAKQLKIRPDSQSSISGKSLMQQLTCTTVFVFVAFLLRSVFSTVYAFAHLLNDYEKTTVLCPGTQWRCDSKCNNVFSHMVQWMNFTPQFQLTVVLISSPMALLVSLWGMTSASMLKIMRSTSTSQRELIPMPQKSLL
jgi:hypothetical protein